MGGLKGFVNDDGRYPELLIVGITLGLFRILVLALNLEGF